MKLLRIVWTISVFTLIGGIIGSVLAEMTENVRGVQALGKARTQFAITANDSLLLSDQTLKEINKNHLNVSNIRKNGRQTIATLKDGTQIHITNLFFPDKINLLDDLEFKPVSPNQLTGNKGVTSGFANGEFYMNGLYIPQKFKVCQYEQGRKLDIITRTEKLLHISGNIGFLNFSDSPTNSKRTIGIQFNEKTSRMETVLYNSPNGLVLIIVSHNKNIYLEGMFNFE